MPQSLCGMWKLEATSFGKWFLLCFKLFVLYSRERSMSL